MPGDLDEINQRNTDAIIKAMDELDEVTYDSVSSLLPRLLIEEQLILEHSVYTPADLRAVHGIGRYLIYDHKDKNNPFSIWVFALGSEQKTTIHDHLYEGTVIVLNGPVSEKYYKPTKQKAVPDSSPCHDAGTVADDDSVAEKCIPQVKHLARRVDRVDRYRFHFNRDNLKDGFVHQLKRREVFGDGTSVTIHVYKMEAHCVKENKTLDNRNLKIIYTNDKSADEEGNAPYKGEYLQLGPGFSF